MEIILKQDVIGLGYKHDIVNVKSGYGRNYLIPTGRGVIASDKAKKALAEELKQKAKKLEKQKADAQSLADKLAQVKIVIAAKVSRNGTIYGSVNNVMVADELAKLGFEIDRRLITARDIKTVGDHVALVRVHKEVTVEVPVQVIPEEAPVEEAPAAEAAPASEVAAEESIEEDIEEAAEEEAAEE